MQKKLIRLVIADLDNTLYDWYGAFVPAFYAMVDAAAELTGISVNGLLDDLRIVHQRHGNSEHPFALLEAQSIEARFPNMARHEIRAHLDEALHAFNHEQDRNLRLYDGVAESLTELHKAGIPIVAYTDARVVNSLARLKRLGIKSLMARLYAPATRVSVEDSADAHDDLVKLLPAEDRKPNPQTLRDIYTEFGTTPQTTLYIGDSLVRDIYMATTAKVKAAWAKYGTLYDKNLWSKLVRVTHWTDADVAREQDLKREAEGTQPDCVLEKFSDIFLHYDFWHRAETADICD